MLLVNEISRIGTAENLPGGSTYDLLIVSTPDGFPSGQVKFVLENSPRKVTGIQKVAQLFMKVLFTQKGSDVINYNLGTNFPELAIGANRTTEDNTFMVQISASIRDAEAQTQGILYSSKLDTASQLRSVEIIGMNLQADALIMYLKLTTLAGETASVAVPFPEMNLKLQNA